jgi:hypothetical protein
MKTSLKIKTAAEEPKRIKQLTLTLTLSQNKFNGNQKIIKLNYLIKLNIIYS